MNVKTINIVDRVATINGASARHNPSDKATGIK